MTDTLTPPRILQLPVDVLADLIDGYFHLITNFDHGWSLGLIFADGARELDEDLAGLNEDAGAAILWLHEDQLYQLATGEPAQLSCQGERYLISVEGVEDLEELLAERHEAED